MQTNEDIEICEHCGAKLRAYWVGLTPGLISALDKFRGATQVKGRNKIHLLKDMNGTAQELTRHEWNNFSRLRFHGLVAKFRENGVNESGYWLLTRRGHEFLNGEVKIPKRVKIFRNRIQEHSEELVSVSDVLGETPYFEKIGDIEYEPFTFETDENGQTKII